MPLRLNSGKPQTGSIGTFRAAGNNGLGGDDEYATPNQIADTLTNGQTKTKYEANADTNAFTDTEKTKLGTIEDSAEVNPTNVETKTAYEANADTNAFTDTEKTKLGNAIVEGNNAKVFFSETDDLGSGTGTVTIDITDRNDFKINQTGVLTLQTTSQAGLSGFDFAVAITANGSAVTINPAFFTPSDQSVDFDTTNGKVNLIIGRSDGSTITYNIITY